MTPGNEIPNHNNPADPNGTPINTPTNNQEPNSGAYVLNALGESEREEFETQLDGSDELRNEVTELNDTALLLGLAVEPVQPSADLKASIMAKLASTPQLPREVPPVRTLQPVPAVRDDDHELAEMNSAPDAALQSASSIKTQARWFQRPIVALTSVAAAVALIVGGGVIANTINNNTQVTQQASALATITNAADVQSRTAEVATGGTAKLSWSAELGKSALTFDGLAALPSDKAYELWYINGDGVATSAGLYHGDANWVVLDGTMTAGDVVGVTVEPRSGSEQPTTTPIVAIPSGA